MKDFFGNEKNMLFSYYISQILQFREKTLNLSVYLVTIICTILFC